MANNEVFVNGLEVACKAADGLSRCAFPDPCWSPPPPKGGPVVIPYANTVYARDLANATKTVMITGLPVAQRDKSYFATSTGNEAATNTFAKGYMSHVIKGKAYFKSWSMNVFVEGYNVCRHTDLITHNHGSDPGNSGVWRYLDTKDEKKPCKKNKERVEKECGVTKNENEDFRKSQDKRNDKREAYNKRVKANKQKPILNVRNKTWKDKHCLGVLISPDTNPENIKKRFENIQKDMEDMLDDFLESLPEKAKQEIQERGTDYAKRTTVKHGAALGCSVLGLFTELICQGAVLVTDVIDGAITVASMAIDAVETASKGYELYAQIENYKDYVQEIKDILGDKERLGKFRDDLIEDMKEAVKKNDCLSARRCMLVPFEKSKQNAIAKGETAKGGKKDAKKTIADKTLGLGDSRGCCPGQTPHHLIPDSWVNHCSGYNYKEAPTVCLEGTSHSMGSHGECHDIMDALTDKTKGAKLPKGAEMESAILQAADSHRRLMEQMGYSEWFGLADFCDKECIEAQLKYYYGKMNCTPNPKKKTEGGGVKGQQKKR